MAKVVDLRTTDDPRDVVHRAVHLLTAGELVAFPTETVYVACANALIPSAVRKLTAFRRDAAHVRPKLLLKGIQQAIDYVPRMGRLGRKLARRCWPGPVTLAFDVAGEEGLLRAMPSETQSALTAGGEIWIRVPAHPCIQEVLRSIPFPLVTACLIDEGEKPPATADLMPAALAKDVALVIDDGECRYAEPATVVRVTDRSWSVVRRGVVTETMIGRLASEVFLFVCTGNTCRSPLAEGFFRKLLADRLKCAEDELTDRGYMVLSAGMNAQMGAPASSESVDVARGHGVDLRNHASQPVTERLLEQADRIYTMTQAHREAILASHPDLADRVELLSRDKTDVSDPIGGRIEEYEACRHEIERNLRAVLETLPVP